MCLECCTFHPNRFTFGGVIPERVNTIKTGRKVSNIRLKPSFEPNKCNLDILLPSRKKRVAWTVRTARVYRLQWKVCQCAAWRIGGALLTERNRCWVLQVPGKIHSARCIGGVIGAVAGACQQRTVDNHVHDRATQPRKETASPRASMRARINPV